MPAQACRPQILDTPVAMPNRVASFVQFANSNSEEVPNPIYATLQPFALKHLRLQLCCAVKALLEALLLAQFIAITEAD